MHDLIIIRALQAAVLLICLYPFSMLACIVVTANHFIFDAISGAAALVAGDAPSCVAVIIACIATLMTLQQVTHECRAHMANDGTSSPCCIPCLCLP